MVTTPIEPERLQRIRMSWDDYLALPEDVRAEYVDGEVLVTPPATSGHNKAQRRLANLIEEALVSGLDVVTESGWKRGTRARIPDVAVYERKEDVVFYEQVPLLVVEVLSPSTRSEDTVRKSYEYVQAGIGQYWILDRQHRTLVVFAHNGDGWDHLLELDDEHPTGEVSVGEHGTVALDLAAILAP